MANFAQLTWNALHAANIYWKTIESWANATTPKTQVVPRIGTNIARVRIADLKNTESESSEC